MKTLDLESTPGDKLIKGATHTEYARLGNTGMKVSRLCLGCMGFGDAQLEEAIGTFPMKLTSEDVTYLEEPYIPHRIVGHQ